MTGTDNKFLVFFEGVINAVYFTDLDNTDHEANGCDLSVGAEIELEREAKSFFATCRNHIPEGMFHQAGVDFWLTRNGHGTGFWDRGEYNGWQTFLTLEAESFGEAHVYLGDDGLAHIG